MGGAQGKFMTSRQTYFLLSLVVLIQLAPISQVWITTNDDTRLANAAMCGGIREVWPAVWDLTVSQGRSHLGKIFSVYLPLIFDNFLYFKFVTYGALFCNFLFFGYFCKLFFRSTTYGVIAFIISLVWLQNSWGTAPITAHPGLWTIELNYLALLKFKWVTQIHLLWKNPVFLSADKQLS